MSVFVPGLIRLFPTVTISQVKPSSGTVRYWVFTVDKKDNELLCIP